MIRPLITEYSDPVTYLHDMIAFRRSNEADFSIARACRGRYRCSPALISNILARKRRVTLDRVGDIAAILDLSAREKQFLREWLQKDQKPRSEPAEQGAAPTGKRRRVSSFLLKDWLHIYVKDAVRLASVQGDRAALYKELGGIASQKRIDRALQFLLHHGYLCKDGEGRLVESEPLHVTGDKDADRKIRKFHVKALDIAREGLELYGVEERLAQALVLPLDPRSYSELMDLLQHFSQDLQSFAERHASADQRLYQLIFHLTPTGGSREPK